MKSRTGLVILCIGLGVVITVLGIMAFDIGMLAGAWFTGFMVYALGGAIWIGGRR